MTNDEIKELIQLVMTTGVAELEVQRGENRVRIRRAGNNNEVTLPNNFGSSGGNVMPGNPQQPQPMQQSAPPQPPAGMDASLATVKSPIVGTYYDSPSPGAAPFVKPGDVVQPGQVLCIIESMKLMNEIEAEVSGTIVNKLVENGRPVEYGEALFTVRPR